MNSTGIFGSGIILGAVLIIIGAYIYAKIIYPAWQERRAGRLDDSKIMKELKKK